MTDTYDRRVQLGASRRRLEDAKVLHSQKRWTGAIYLGGYAIECSLKSLICFEEEKNNFKETKLFIKGLQGADLHNLVRLLDAVPTAKHTIELDRKPDGYQEAWNVVSSIWRTDELRYSYKTGNEKDSTRFIQAVEKLHRLLLAKQMEA